MSGKPKFRIKFGKRYKKDLKRLRRSNIDLAPLEDVIDQLAADEKLPDRHRDHDLKGKLKGSRECHIGPDWILRYSKDHTYLYLVLLSTGDHRHVLGVE